MYSWNHNGDHGFPFDSSVRGIEEWQSVGCWPEKWFHQWGTGASPRAECSKKINRILATVHCSSHQDFMNTSDLFLKCQIIHQKIHFQRVKRLYAQKKKEENCGLIRLERIKLSWTIEIILKFSYFLVCIESLLSELRKRRSNYADFSKKVSFLTENFRKSSVFTAHQRQIPKSTPAENFDFSATGRLIKKRKKKIHLCSPKIF